MDKIWIITIEDICDYESFHTNPIAFRDEKAAEEHFQALKDGMQADYSQELAEEDYTYEDNGWYAEVYSEDYARDHYRVTLSCVELQ